jgi:uncharacterized membrane protein (UPF0127 family)
MKKFLAGFFALIIFFLVVFFLIYKYKSNPSLALPLSGEGLGEVSPPDKGDLGGLNSIKYVQIVGQNIKVSLALTPAEQEQGLSARQDLAENEGMLFVFTNPGKYPFWMKDMNFSIDIIWLSEDLKVVYIKKDARPESYPETYGPGENVPTPKGAGIPTVNVGTKYVLEVMSGFSDKNNLKVGDGVLFSS